MPGPVRTVPVLVSEGHLPACANETKGHIGLVIMLSAGSSSPSSSTCKPNHPAPPAEAQARPVGHHLASIGIARAPRGQDHIIIVFPIETPSQRQLHVLIHAGNALRLGLDKRRQSHSGKNRDDRDASRSPPIVPLNQPQNHRSRTRSDAFSIRSWRSGSFP